MEWLKRLGFGILFVTGIVMVVLGMQFPEDNPWRLLVLILCYTPAYVWAYVLWDILRGIKQEQRNLKQYTFNQLVVNLNERD